MAQTKIFEAPITYEEIRSNIIEILLLPHIQDGGFAFFTLCTELAKLFVEKGLVIPDRINGDKRVDYMLSNKDAARAQDILWDLIIEGIIRPGPENETSNEMRNSFQAYHLTEYGRNVLKNGLPSPYDPDGYLKRLESSISNIDKIIIRYLDESLRAFRIGCLLSSTITLGCASEKAVLILISEFTLVIPHGRQRSTFETITSKRPIKTQFEELRKRLEYRKEELPSKVKDNLSIFFASIFNIFRIYRNDAGHPTGINITREEVNVLLVAFPNYLTTVYHLIEWCKKNKATT